MLAYIPPRSPADTFPPTRDALREPNGLLAVGGDLSAERLLAAYSRGIFPWYSDGDPLLWWTPDPRTVLVPETLRISRSLGKRIRSGRFTVRIDTRFDDVVRACAAPRATDTGGTWIDEEMREAYGRLHARGYAHTVESWRDGQLVGGLYGVALGRIFFGESMFARESDASKVALAHLCSLGFGLIDCQMASAHLTRLGATQIRRRAFEDALREHIGREPVLGPAAPVGGRHVGS